MSIGAGAGAVEDVQRTKILEALVELTAARPPGAAAVTTAETAARAGISRRELERLFPDRDACMLAAFELAVNRAGARMSRAYAAEDRWRDGIKGALASLLGFLEEEPGLGRLCVVDSLGAGDDVLRRRAEVLAALAQIVDRGRDEAPSRKVPPHPVIAEGVVGAVLSVIQNRLLATEPQPLMGLFGSLMSIIVLPYLGSAAARRELTRPVPRRWAPARNGPAGSETASSVDGDLRLTYRTARVLSAIGEYPGASNREVAERAGIADQGQVSKLLSRLESRALITKLGDLPSRGAPNAWCLTGRGEWLRLSGAARLGSADVKQH
jgi:AcrR family transcriptional regulator